MGVLPEALFNFLLLLGWTPPDGREILTRAEAETLFDLGEVHRSAAVFDVEKLLWLNHQYIQQKPAGEIASLLEGFLASSPVEGSTLVSLVKVLQPRARTLREMAEQAEPFFVRDEDVAYEEEAVRKHLKGEDLGQRLTALRAELAATSPFDVAATEASVRALAERTAISAAKYIHPLRVALLGRTSSPPIFDVLAILGKERSIARLDRLIARSEA